MSTHVNTRLQSALNVIGSSTATSVPVLVIVVCCSAILSVVALPTTTWDRPLARILIVLSTLAVLVCCLLIGRITVLRHVDQRPAPWRTLIVFYLSAAAMGVFLALALEWSGLAEPGSMTRGVPGGSTMILLVLATLTVHAVTQHRVQRNRLSDERHRLRRTRAQIPAMLDRNAATMLEEVTASVDAQVAGMSTMTAVEALAALRFTGQDIVRPLSHELEARRLVIDPAPREHLGLGLDWSRLLQDATSGRPIPIRSLAVLLAAVSVGFTTRTYGLPIGLAVICLMAGVVLVGGFVANRVLVRIRAEHTWLRALAFGVTYVLLGLVIAASLVLLGWDTDLPALAARSVSAVLITGWCISLVRGARIQFERTERELASVTRELDWELARANQLQRQQQKRLARTLHGPVQATVNAAAIKVDAAILAGTWTPEQASKAQSDVARALALLNNDDARDTVDLANVFARIQATWAGISNIEFHASNDVLALVTQDPTCAHVLADIITEACANAAWHARAPHVSVTIDQPSSRRLVRVVVEDDGGTQPTLEAHEGMGTRILDEVAVEWARTSTTTGTLLIAVLPTAIGPTRDQNSEPLRSRHLRRP